LSHFGAEEQQPEANDTTVWLYRSQDTSHAAAIAKGG
jgi:hypothetical protein